MFRRVIFAALSCTLCILLTACIQIIPWSSSPTRPTQTPAIIPTAPPKTTVVPKPSVKPTESSDQLSPLSIELLDYFTALALGNEGGDPKWDGVIKRWEKPVKVEVLGDATDEDMATLNAFLIDLGKLSLDIAFLEGEGDESGDIVISFVPLADMAKAVPRYVEDNWGYMHIDWDDNARITKAQIAIATDVTNQTQRNHLILEEVTRSLGFLGDSNKYPDSIFYGDWTETQSLADNDYYMIAMLYSKAVFAGQSKADATSALTQLLISNPPE